MKVDSRLLFQKTGIFQSFKLGALSRVSIFCLGTLGIWHQSFVSFFVICYDSNAMPFSNYFSNVVTILRWFSVLGFRCAVASKKTQDRFLGSGRQFDKLLIISTSLGRRCSAVTSWSIANQDCHGTSARSQGAPVQVAAGRRCSVAQTWSDWIRRSACACAAARQIAVGTARRRLQRLRAGAGEREAAVTAPWRLWMCTKNTARNTVGNTYKNTARYTARNTYKNTVRYTVGNTFIYWLMYMHVFLMKILPYTDIYWLRSTHHSDSICLYKQEIHAYTAPVKRIYCS